MNTLIGGWWVRKTFREEFNGYWMCYVGSAGAGVGSASSVEPDINIDTGDASTTVICKGADSLDCIISSSTTALCSETTVRYVYHVSVQRRDKM